MKNDMGQQFLFVWGYTCYTFYDLCWYLHLLRFVQVDICTSWRPNQKWLHSMPYCQFQLLLRLLLLIKTCSHNLFQEIENGYNIFVQCTVYEKGYNICVHCTYSEHEAQSIFTIETPIHPSFLDRHHWCVIQKIGMRNTPLGMIKNFFRVVNILTYLLVFTIFTSLKCDPKDWYAKHTPGNDQKLF